MLSATEASGDLYAAGLAQRLRERHPDWQFFGCAGVRMQAAGVEPVVDAAELGVVGLVEVVRHIPRIYGLFRRLASAAVKRRPRVAILTDSPDFHLRLAARLKRQGIPVLYLVAPQAWAWRRRRVHAMRRALSQLLCIFPFEEAFFRGYGVPTTYIGHPLTRLVKPSVPAAEFRARHHISPDATVLTLLPGSRTGEMSRHLPILVEAVERLEASQSPAQPLVVLLATPPGFSSRVPPSFFRERGVLESIQRIEGATWDCISCADLVLAASGTVTVETALLGRPMVTFYRVTGLSWLLGRLLVRVPFYSMVNLIAGRRIVPELMQGECTGERLAAECRRLLDDEAARHEMERALQVEVTQRLSTGQDPLEYAARIVEEWMEKDVQ